MTSSATAPTLVPLEQLWKWQLNARCRSTGSDVFFGHEGEGRADRIRRERVAMRICTPCSVRDECLSHAVHVGERFGVWGGMTESQRKAGCR